MIGLARPAPLNPELEFVLALQLPLRAPRELRYSNAAGGSKK
jgi:hypothetical protein